MSLIISTAVTIWVFWGILGELFNSAWYGNKNAQIALGVCSLLFIGLLRWIWS